MKWEKHDAEKHNKVLLLLTWITTLFHQYVWMYVCVFVVVYVYLYVMQWAQIKIWKDTRLSVSTGEKKRWGRKKKKQNNYLKSYAR